MSANVIAAVTVVVFAADNMIRFKGETADVLKTNPNPVTLLE